MKSPRPSEGKVRRPPVWEATQDTSPSPVTQRAPAGTVDPSVGKWAPTGNTLELPFRLCVLKRPVHSSWKKVKTQTKMKKYLKSNEESATQQKPWHLRYAGLRGNLSPSYIYPYTWKDTDTSIKPSAPKARKRTAKWMKHTQREITKMKVKLMSQSKKIATKNQNPEFLEVNKTT